MSKATTLTIAQIAELCDLKAELENAKIKLEVKKQELGIDDLPEGKYFADGIGTVQKTLSVRETTDYKRLLAEHPEIDAEKYKTFTEVASVLIKPTIVKKSVLGFLKK